MTGRARVRQAQTARVEELQWQERDAIELAEATARAAQCAREECPEDPCCYEVGTDYFGQPCATHVLSMEPCPHAHHIGYVTPAAVPMAIG
jgi:hypothetical protein